MSPDNEWSLVLVGVIAFAMFYLFVPWTPKVDSDCNCGYQEDPKLPKAKVVKRG